MKFRVPGTALVLATVLSTPAIAQVPADTFRLREVVVTATRLPTPAAHAPGTVSIVTGDELRERGIRYIADALRTVPGVTVVQSAGPGALTSVFMRGGESDYVQLLIDGIQVNEPGGAFNWAHLRAEDIDRIEVVRGPGSVLYGSDAVSGVVQIFTRAGGAPRVDAGASSGFGDKREPDGEGTYRTTAYDASVTGAMPSLFGGAARLQYGGSAARHESNGLYAFNSDYDNTTVSGRIRLLAPRLDAAFNARGSKHEYHYPTSGSGAVIDTNQFATGDTRSFGLDAGYRLTGAVELRVLATTHWTSDRTEDPPEPGHDDTYWSTGEQSRRKLDGRVNARLGSAAILSAGAEREWQAATTAFESVSDWGTFSDETDENRRNTGAYAQLHATPIAHLAATVGARIDHNARFGTFRTGRAAVSWITPAGARLHGAWGTAFKEPTFYENFATGFVRGNPALQPEQARSVEAGIEHTFAGDRITLGATWFDQRFRNLIQYTAAPPMPDASNYQNVGEARARGAELSGHASAGRLSASAQYTYTDTRVTDAGFGTDAAFQQGQRLLRRPLHGAALRSSYLIVPAARAFVDLRHTGRRDDLDFTDPDHWEGRRVDLPAFTTVDAGAEFNLLRDRSTDLRLTIRAHNILDARYAEIHNFPAPGRVISIGLRAGRGL